MNRYFTFQNIIPSLFAIAIFSLFWRYGNVEIAFDIRNGAPAIMGNFNYTLNKGEEALI